MTVAPFGRTPDGQAVEVYTLRNVRGMQVRAITYGAIIQAIQVPDRSGRIGDVTLGYDSLPGYLTTSPYFGAVVGRYANRIARGRFTLEGRTYRLATNNGPNHLHGGLKGYDKVVWKAQSFQRGDTVGVKFQHTSPDRDEGYPGTVRVSVTYSLTPKNELIGGVPSDHRSGHPAQSLAAHVLEPGGGGKRADSPARADDRGGSVHAGRFHSDSYR